MQTSHLKIARTLTTLLDNRFSLFGIRFGIDPLLDFVPGLGSAIGATLSLYLVYIAYTLEVPRKVYLLMLWHVLLDYMFGIIPVVGLAADLLYKSNVKNIQLLEEYGAKNGTTILEGEIIDK